MRAALRRTLGVMAILSLALVGAGAAYAWVAAKSYDDNIEIIEEAMPPDEVPASPDYQRPEERVESTTVLVVGSDGGSDGSSDSENLSEVPGEDRSDTIMLAHITDDGMEVVSILRDLWVEVPGYGEHKINAAYSLGGMPLLVETVESLTDIRIDHVAAIDLAGFQAVVERLGTVTVDSPVAFTTRDGIEITDGPQEMDAQTAESFVRERYAFPDGDEQRAQNQQAFIAGVIESVDLADVHQVQSLIETFAPYLSVDEGLDSTTAAQLAVSARPVSFTALDHAGSGTERGQDVLYPDDEAFAQISDEWSD